MARKKGNEVTKHKRSWEKVFDFTDAVKGAQDLVTINTRLRGLNAVIQNATSGYLRLSTHVYERGPGMVYEQYVTIYVLLLLIDHDALHDGTSDVLDKVPLFAIRAPNPIVNKLNKYGLDIIADRGFTSFTQWYHTQEGVIGAVESMLGEDWFKDCFTNALELAVLANNNINPQAVKENE